MTVNLFKQQVDTTLVGRRRRRVPRSRWTYVGVALVAFAAMSFIDTATTNPNFGWPVVGTFLLHPSILSGLGFALQMMVVVMVLGTALGIIVALMRTSANRMISGAAWLYIWFFRGTPLLIQIIFWFNIAALFPQIELAVPFGPTLLGVDSNTLITPLTAAILALSLNEAAYMAEVVRGGLLGVNKGQGEAAKALGMGPLEVFKIVMPQAIRIIIPATANQVVNAFKNTSLVSVIGVADLLHSAQIIYSINYQTIPLLLVAALWYLFITSLLGYGQGLLEQHYSKGYSPVNRRWRKKRQPKVETVESDGT
ncbi:MAG: amino acid ABC transporter permease [Homoserinimonas sp.]